jgi:putrescine transport system ATP-binding protein
MKLKPSATAFSTPLVTIRGLTKHYGSQSISVIPELNLDIMQGEIFALLGPSGCGKTTLMRMLAGFESPTSGSITIAGHEMQGVPPYLRPVNMMFQSYALFPHMTVWQNVAFGLQQESLLETEINQRVDDVLKMVKMAEFVNRKPRQLSGGQQQRVALARSLVKRPKLLLLDEPLGALDKNTREHTQMELLNIQTLLGVTFVMVTHDQEEAMIMANRIAVMKDGVIHQMGTPEEVYRYPVNQFVADFIGNITFIEAKMAHAHNASHWHISSSELQADWRVPRYSSSSMASKTALSPHNLSTGDPVILGIRPEVCFLADERPESGNAVKALLVEHASIGHAMVYHLRLPNEQLVTVRQSSSSIYGHRTRVNQTPCWLCWPEDHGMIFDFQTQNVVI